MLKGNIGSPKIRIPFSILNPVHTQPLSLPPVFAYIYLQKSTHVFYDLILISVIHTSLITKLQLFLIYPTPLSTTFVFFVFVSMQKRLSTIFLWSIKYHNLSHKAPSGLSIYTALSGNNLVSLLRYQTCNTVKQRKLIYFC